MLATLSCDVNGCNNNNNNNNNKNNNEARRPDIVFLDKKEGEVIITALVLPPLVMTG